MPATASRSRSVSHSIVPKRLEYTCSDNTKRYFVLNSKHSGYWWTIPVPRLRFALTPALSRPGSGRYGSFTLYYTLTCLASCPSHLRSSFVKAVSNWFEVIIQQDSLSIFCNTMRLVSKRDRPRPTPEPTQVCSRHSKQYTTYVRAAFRCCQLYERLMETSPRRIALSQSALVLFLQQILQQHSEEEVVHGCQAHSSRCDCFHFHRKSPVKVVQCQEALCMCRRNESEVKVVQCQEALCMCRRNESEACIPIPSADIDKSATRKIWKSVLHFKTPLFHSNKSLSNSFLSIDCSYEDAWVST